MSSCIESVEEVCQVRLIRVFYWTSELIPCLGFECWDIFSEFLVKILLDSCLVYTVSSLFILTPINQSNKFLIWVSPCAIGFVEWFVVEGKCCDNLVFCSLVPEGSIYSLHGCYLTGELVFLECECIVECSICCWYVVPCLYEIWETFLIILDDSCAFFLVVECFSCTRSDSLIESEYALQSPCGIELLISMYLREWEEESERDDEYIESLMLHSIIDKK